jgi:hypothetical protein
MAFLWTEPVIPEIWKNYNRASKETQILSILEQSSLNRWATPVCVFCSWNCHTHNDDVTWFKRGQRESFLPDCVTTPLYCQLPDHRSTDCTYVNLNYPSWTGTVLLKLSLVLKYAPRLSDVYGSGDIAPRIIKLCIKWRQVVSFTPRPLCPQENLRYPLNRRLGEPQSLSGRCC